MLGLVFCINSSKVYCKFKFTCSECSIKKVLIVAKCIVNFSLALLYAILPNVLIVAKCIVNENYRFLKDCFEFVLIVAKCIVNLIC